MHLHPPTTPLSQPMLTNLPSTPTTTPLPLVFITKGDALGDFVPLRHPRTGKKAQFVFNKAGELLEAQQMSGDDHSFFMDDNVMKDGSIFLCTPIDPNFILLHYLDKARNKSAEHAGRFGVLADSVCDESFPAINRVAEAKNARINRICDVKETHGERYIRLSDDKVMSWLEAKVEAIATKLVAQSQEEAVVSTFKRDGPLQDAPTNSTTPMAAGKAPVAQTPSVGNGEREFAVGLLAEYLNGPWTEMLAKHVGVRSPESITKDDSTPKMCNIDSYIADAPSKEDLSKKRKAEAALTTNGQRQLKKVDTSKMKSMMSFFKPKPKVK